MTINRRFSVSLFIAVPLLGILACQAVLAPDDFWSDVGIGDEPTAIPQSGTSNGEDKQDEIRSSDQPDSDRDVVSHQRLSGMDLPDLDFGPVGESPNDVFRPRLSGEPQSLDTEHFRLHYTLSGDDAVPTQDSDGNGHPDYVEEMAIAFEYSWFAQIEHFGWTAPPADKGAGGNDLYDIYLENIYDDGAAGYTEGGFQDTIVGDNPNSDITETRASHSFISMENDYAEYSIDPAPGVSSLDFMRSTAAHELHHAIQYGYDSQEAHDWLWEATATWMQDEVFDLINDADYILPAAFKATDSCQLAYGGEDRVEDTDHWYGLWIFIRFLSENYGHQSVLELWELTISEEGYSAWDSLLASRNTTLKQHYTEYSLALLNRDFEEGANYPSVRLEGEAYLDQAFFPVDGVAQMGADYIEIIAYDDILVSLSNSELDGLVVGIKNGESHIYPFVDGSVGVSTQSFEHVYLIVVNPNRASSESNCRFYDYNVNIDLTDSTNQAEEVLPAPNFRPPIVEGLLNPEDYFEE